MKIEKGVTLLEASAGTGKTYTLAELFLRLIVEEGVPAREILVVTYTKAATSELRERIRARLQEALMLNPGNHRLIEALEFFDEVSIDTIHAFCQRTLRDQAFETGIYFDPELIPDQSGIIQEVAADYFRKEICEGDSLIASLCYNKGLLREGLAKLLQTYLQFPELRLVPEIPKDREVARVNNLKKFETAFKDFRDCWNRIEDKKSLHDYFPESRKGWTIGAYAKPEIVASKIALLTEAFENSRLEARWPRQAGSLSSEGVSGALFGCVTFFSISEINGSGTGKNKVRPVADAVLERFFAACEDFSEQAEVFKIGLILDFLLWGKAEISARKLQAKQQSYDDLIQCLAQVLEREGVDGPLAKSVQKKYQAALIDEFQDTDPLQWKIFHRIFALPESHWLFLVGDPKQAIYGFRGADVNTYVKAAETAKHRHTLDTNWRSTTCLVESLNAVFNEPSGGGNFVEEGIRYQEVKAAPESKGNRKPFRYEDNELTPLQIWHWQPDDAVTSDRANSFLPDRVAGEIVRLLKGATLGEARLQTRDIAVLVESHHQAALMQEALRKVGIPGVELGNASVMESTEARELQWLLLAILQPSRERVVKSALTTDLMGWNGDRLVRELADESKWMDRLQQFAESRKSWEETGFFAMFSSFIQKEGVLQNLQKFPNGERRITNLLHLVELLETACKDEHLSPIQLVQWLEEKRLLSTREMAAEDHQLRLESDSDAVRIVTIHSSKGLEYPVVFCPFLQKDASLKALKDPGTNKILLKEEVRFHDAQGDMRWDLLQSDEANQIRARKESLAEKMRLFYVALTRAQNLCYLVSAPYGKKLRSTALAWLMQPDKSASDPVAALEEIESQATDWKSRWDQLSEVIDVTEIQELDPLAESSGTFEPISPGGGGGNARYCSRSSILQAWYLSSFTQLASHSLGKTLLSVGDTEIEEPNHSVIAPEFQKNPEGVFALPASSLTGNCLHEILESFDFSEAAGDSLNLALIQERLEAYGFSVYLNAVTEMLDRLRIIPLKNDRNEEVILSEIKKNLQLTEMEFYFPTRKFADGQPLINVIRRSTTGGFSLEDHSKIGSYLKGFIDLIFKGNDGRFYIVDWKSNRLGFSPEDYRSEAMQAKIEEQSYDLQYHLYTVALDKYLRLRIADYDYDTHFGGVWYLFLRGIHSDYPGCGTYYVRPEKVIIEQMSELLGSEL